MNGPQDKREAARKRLILALDVSLASEAARLAEDLHDHVGVYKIGLELLYAGGANLAWSLAEAGHSVFIDAKLHDIPNTVERAAAQIAKKDAAFLTVHAQDKGMLHAARQGCSGSGTKLLGVTVLTHLEEADFQAQGDSRRLQDIVLDRAQLAYEAGLDGVVCSPREAAAIKSHFGADFLAITPGIRGVESSVISDQRRTATPAEALRSGADYLVTGRPILQARNPREAAQAILLEMQTALMSGPNAISVWRAV